MLFWTPILEYIKIRPSPISKLSPDALVRAIPEKNTWGEGGRRQAIYFSMGGWCGKFSSFMGHWCLTKSNYMCGWYFAVWKEMKEYYLPKKERSLIKSS